MITTSAPHAPPIRIGTVIVSRFTNAGQRTSLEDVQGLENESATPSICCRASYATVVSSGAHSRTTALSRASGSVSRPPVRPSEIDSTRDVAWKQQPHRWIGRNRLECERRIACPENHVCRKPRPRFSRNAARRSISVSTPNPSCLRVSRTRGHCRVVEDSFRQLRQRGLSDSYCLFDA